MKWRIIKKDPSTQPDKGEYSDWKEQIAEECFNQCIYCSIHENQFGGIDHFHVEHFRPKSKFEDLKNDIMNLYYACPVCNRFKSNDWPSEPDDLEIVCYPDPSKTNYYDLFEEVNGESDYYIFGKYVSSRYLIERLFLNRPQLLFERREITLNNKHSILRDEIRNLINDLDPEKNGVLIKKTWEIQDKLQELLLKRKDVRPYRRADIQKK